MACDPALREAAHLVADLPPASALWRSPLRRRYGREVVGLLSPNGAGRHW